ncbi:hypothetical protein [Methanothrix sp.]|uniref:hypothetical protein n=1 Tax=Methanothrix sp. TaxID=90426 RepID=UPI003D0C9BB6
MDSDLAATKGGNNLVKHSGSKFRVYEEERSILDALPSDIRGTYQDIIKHHSQLLDLLAQE